MHAITLDTSLEVEAPAFSQWFDRAVPAFDEQGEANYLNAAGELVEGIYLDLPNDIYHALPALSSSAAKEFAKSPAHYERKYLSDVCNRRTQAQADTFDGGSLGHELVLEPEGFLQRYFREVMPIEHPDALITADEIRAELKQRGLKTSGDKSEIAQRLHHAAPELKIFDLMIAENRNTQGEASEAVIDGVVKTLYGGKQEVRGQVWDKAHRAQRTVRSDPQTDLMFSYGKAEVTFIARCPQTGLLLKCKFDWLRFDDEAIDLKTTRSADPTEFNQQMKTLKYDLQEAFYTYVAALLGVQLRDFIFVAVEFETADIVQPYRLGQKRKKNAREQLNRILFSFAKCQAEGKWPGYYPGSIIELD